MDEQNKTQKALNGLTLSLKKIAEYRIRKQKEKSQSSVDEKRKSIKQSCSKSDDQKYL